MIPNWNFPFPEEPWPGPRWPDGVPVHPHTLRATLSCGCSFVSKGWRGDPGETICCDNCHTLQTIVAVVPTDEQAPQGWNKYRVPGA